MDAHLLEAMQQDGIPCFFEDVSTGQQQAALDIEGCGCDAAVVVRFCDTFCRQRLRRETANIQYLLQNVGVQHAVGKICQDGQSQSGLGEWKMKVRSNHSTDRKANTWRTLTAS